MAPHSLRTDDASRLIGRRSGFTLIESLIASVVLAIAVVGIAGAISASFQEKNELDKDSASVAVARALLEEAAAKPFASDTSTSKAGAGNFDRTTYTNVADYDQYHDSSPFTTLGGATLDIGSGYSRSVTYTCPASVTVNGVTTSRSDFGRLTVTVTAPSGRNITVSRLITNFTLSR